MLSNELNPKTFDLVGMLSGRDYPETEIEVYFNEKLGFTIEKLRSTYRDLEIRGEDDAAKKVYEELEGLVKSTPQHKFTISLRGIPEKVRRSILDKVHEEFPEKTNMLGMPEPNPKGDEAYTIQMWRAYATSFTTPDGDKNPITDAEIQAIYDEAPATVHAQLTKAIEDLREGSVKGFEYAAKEADFLSHASPEG